MLGASGEAGASQREATASLTTAPLGKENLLGGFFVVFFWFGVFFIFFFFFAAWDCYQEGWHKPGGCAEPRWQLEHALAGLCSPGLASPQGVRIPTVKTGGDRRLVQEASALLGGACVFCLCNGEVNKQRGKPVWKQKLALGEQLGLVHMMLH